MFNTVQQNVKLENLPWKEKHPSFTMDVVASKVKEFGNKNYTGADNFVKIVLEGKDGQKLECEIARSLSQIIVTNKKYKIWYDFLKYPSGILNGHILILCAEEIN